MNKTSELQNNYILNNSNNYKKTVNYHWKEIVDKYLEVIMEYIKYIFENIKIKKTNLSKYIMIRGLDTITHVFRFLLLYTKNLNMTYYNSQKAFYYYVEFIGQISEEEISYLKLNSNDAILYVYKKTIYQVNDTYRNVLTKDEKIIFELLNEYIYVFKYIIIEFIYENDWKSGNDITPFRIENAQSNRSISFIHAPWDVNEKWCEINENIQQLYQKIVEKNKTYDDIKEYIQWLKDEKWKDISF